MGNARASIFIYFIKIICNLYHTSQVLQKSIDYIQYLLQQRRRQEEQRNALRKDVIALRIMQANYEQIVKAQHSVPGHNEQRLSDQDKFQVVSYLLIYL